MKIGVIIPAAGAATRYLEGGHAARHKLDEDLGGRPLLQRTVELFNTHPLVSAVVVAGPYEPEAFDAFRLKHADRLSMLGARLCRGGQTHRWETVRAALAEVPAEATHIAVHDAARPCASAGLIERVFDAALTHDAVVPCLDVSDTIKRVGETRETAPEIDPIAEVLGVTQAPRRVRLVEQTLARAGLVAAQTPQVFRAEVLRRAYAQADLSSTDDAGLVERLGVQVVVVEGEARNIKVTRPDDLTIARAILGFRPPSEREVHKRF
ncbi:MAG: 2-C-methyl-D-erythritol 4-phosphate cytidylyltransferase [Phycisphaerales bacterium]|nr:2-C-methyl-D-erythritol 4-phosphate cytidylyltransferase [Phycisphaerales bacterium]